MTFFQDTLGQPISLKKEKEWKNKRYDSMWGIFYNICFPKSLISLGPPLISISGFQTSVQELGSSWQSAPLTKNVHKAFG